VLERVLVTGSHGYLGEPFVRHLMASGLARTVIRVPRAALCDVGAWRTMLTDADAVVHCAGQTSLAVAERDPTIDRIANVQPVAAMLTATALETATRSAPLAIVSLGTATQYGLPITVPVSEDHADTPLTVYDQHKLEAEQRLAAAVTGGLVVGTTLRLANVYGPSPSPTVSDRGVLVAMMRRALAGEPLTVFGDGRERRDYLFLDDVLDAMARAISAARAGRLGRPHYLLATGIGTSLRDAFTLVAERVAVRTGRRVPVQTVPVPADAPPSNARDFVGDATRFRAATGWTPRVDLPTGIDRTLASLLAADAPPVDQPR
jgi:nucleoside-diphosphate-sugar epimerase